MKSFSVRLFSLSSSFLSNCLCSTSRSFSLIQPLSFLYSSFGIRSSKLSHSRSFSARKPSKLLAFVHSFPTASILSRLFSCSFSRLARSFSCSWSSCFSRHFSYGSSCSLTIFLCIHGSSSPSLSLCSRCFSHCRRRSSFSLSRLSFDRSNSLGCSLSKYRSPNSLAFCMSLRSSLTSTPLRSLPITTT